MDYVALWDRWVALATLSEEDRKKMIHTLSESSTNACQTIGLLAASEIKQQLENHAYKAWNEYLETATPILMLGTLDGYLFSLMVQGKNPMNENKKPSETVTLSDRWSQAYKKDMCVSYADSIDPIIGLFLQKIQEIRVNQVLALHPDIVKLPYEVTERLNQYIKWAVQQGYIIGLIEQQG